MGGHLEGHHHDHAEKAFALIALVKRLEAAVGRGTRGEAVRGGADKEDAAAAGAALTAFFHRELTPGTDAPEGKGAETAVCLHAVDNLPAAIFRTRKACNTEMSCVNGADAINKFSRENEGSVDGTGPGAKGSRYVRDVSKMAGWSRAAHVPKSARTLDEASYDAWGAKRKAAENWKVGRHEGASSTAAGAACQVTVLASVTAARATLPRPKEGDSDSQLFPEGTGRRVLAGHGEWRDKDGIVTRTDFVVGRSHALTAKGLGAEGARSERTLLALHVAGRRSRRRRVSTSRHGR